ncbi:Site-specific recombinase XerD [Thiorhodovibrio winogradskyi]|uniref:Site-specific recombinase XerD n=1 Tax=Thiorhodovibrio winogradskyi TaxID=77007 RepID=A0ABZ0S9E7_9GAMM|nr:plasmid pRiA4b ORF-3 family protein [Thiorhodovibrio winogradskyi]
MSEKLSKSVYQLKVTLKGTKPPIWRRLLVPADLPLGKLHEVLQLVMGWENYHLHQFISGGRFFGMQDGEFSLDAEIEDENQFKIKDLLSAEKETLGYEYDFGDSWDHKIVLEKILPAEDGQQPPRCIKGMRACPPEDCGGIWGYQELLETLSDPKNPDYEEMLEWVGGEFDPELFDIGRVNKQLALV